MKKLNCFKNKNCKISFTKLKTLFVNSKNIFILQSKIKNNKRKVPLHAIIIN